MFNPHAPRAFVFVLKFCYCSIHCSDWLTLCIQLQPSSSGVRDRSHFGGELLILLLGLSQANINHNQMESESFDVSVDCSGEEQKVNIYGSLVADENDELAGENQDNVEQEAEVLTKRQFTLSV